MVLRNRNDQLLAGLHVTRPCEDIGVRRLSLIGRAGHFPRHRSANRGARNPSDDAQIAFLDVGDVLADPRDDAGALMPEQQRPSESRVVHLMQL